MIKYKCRHCRAKLETTDDLGRKTEPCPSCGKENQVPPSKWQLEQDRLQIQRQKEAQVAVARAQAAEQARLKAEAAAAAKARYTAALQKAKADPETPKAWYCWCNGEVSGPMKESVLQQWINDGKVKSSDSVRPEGVDEWLKLADLPERFSFAQQQNTVRCPKCGSTQLSVNKKGFNAENACCGALLLGPLGLLCGATESNQLMVTCLACGHTWRRA